MMLNYVPLITKSWDKVPEHEEHFKVSISDYPIPDQPTADDLREAAQVRNLLGFIKFVSLEYGSQWVSMRFIPNERQVEYLKSRGYDIYVKEHLEENGVAGHRRVQRYSINWSGVKPNDTELKAI